MGDFVVEWKIDIIADSPLEAAKEALKIMQDPDSIANVFHVIDDKGETTQIDLQEEKENELRVVDKKFTIPIVRRDLQVEISRVGTFIITFDRQVNRSEANLVSIAHRNPNSAVVIGVWAANEDSGDDIALALTEHINENFSEEEVAKMLDLLQEELKEIGYIYPHGKMADSLKSTKR